MFFKFHFNRENCHLKGMDKLVNITKYVFSTSKTSLALKNSNSQVNISKVHVWMFGRMLHV